ncbi:LacI family DNA-binding transcriptional regulator [Cohnella thailandensis]|jgi:Transcriptional regulators|uniref:LacI family DNA-binding transcriptional regulator n=1 Tax=Cohnella thailandensis TaxID=557557 RepID=A0A841SV97_9BACL|nr:LacI family DNA-binding transcriptional regulator [Cohnella thailandensis]MBB6633800.1 LacI family DNA-binding transcriptional regulator [Cohnella thailandensis]MBP1972481.1 LacI family transcriptional regulator [Cohnella thailandensis]
MSKVGIKDIAARANVSTATVSYVLNGTRNVKPATKERVLRVIEELNFKPNAIAQSLKNRRTDTIGVIAEDVTVFNVPEIIDGINDYADRHDLHILLTNLRLDKRIGRGFDRVESYRKHMENAVAELQGKQVEGIVYIGVHPRDLTGMIDTHGKPIVYTYCYTQDDISIQYDDEQASYDAMAYLVKQGHSKIAIISGTMDSLPSRMRFNGFYKAVTEFSLPFNPDWIKMGDWETESGFRLAQELLSLPEPPTAILAMNDVMAAGVLRAASEAGVAVPGELSVIGFDNREFSGYLTPRMTTLELPLHEMGYRAMDSLMKAIRGEEVDRNQSPACKLILRDSVAPPPGD